jgi:hydroxymethylpyrimidine pyrophosphatase-like HAD family hydrolase
VIYSALGQRAPLDKKLAWDPTIAKRKELQAILAPLLPDYAVGIGGSTTIDVTKKGFDKAYAIRWLAIEMKLPVTDIIYVGDALYTGGNDAPVLSTGASTRAVSGPVETLALIESLVREIR